MLKMWQLKRNFLIGESRNFSLANHTVTSIAFEASVTALPNPGRLKRCNQKYPLAFIADKSCTHYIVLVIISIDYEIRQKVHAQTGAID